jgi:hypothetical protein
MLLLALRVDPSDSNGTAFTAATIGTTDGEKFPALRLLAIYNEARMALAQAISARMDERSKSVAVSGNIVTNTTFQFTAGVATKPTGYIRAVNPFSLLDVNGKIVCIMPMESYALEKRQDSVQNPLVFEGGGSFMAVSMLSVPNASTYVLRYYGVSDFVITDVTNGTTLETFNRDWEPGLIQLAEAIANEQGQVAVNELALAIVGDMQAQKVQ